MARYSWGCLKTQLGLWNQCEVTPSERKQGWVYLCPWGCLYDGVFPVDERFAFLQLYVGECVLTVLMCKTTGQCTQEFLGA